MNWRRIESILKDCTKGEPAVAVPRTVPRQHAEFLQRYDGVEGFIAPGQYLMLWRAEELAELNAAYSTSQYLPGVVLIGTDGSDTAFGIDNGGEYMSVPLIGMSPQQANALGSSLEAFLERVAAGAAYTVPG